MIKGLTMRVFSSNWEQAMRREYDGLPSYDRPNLYRLATWPHLQPFRRQIQEWVEELPESPRIPLLVKRLQSRNQFYEAYHELAVGSVLCEMGYTIRYEMPISDGTGEITPDWSVMAEDASVSFVIEVFTANPSDDQRSRTDRRHWFLGRLRAIPYNIFLLIRELPECDPPDKPAAEGIAVQIERWLSQGQLCVGMEMILGKIWFTIERVDCACDHLQYLCCPPPMLYVDLPRLKRKIGTKVAKYRSVLENRHVPLVVAVVPSDGVTLDIEDLHAALLGEQAVAPTSRGAGGAVEHGLIRHPNGLFTCDHSLDPIVSAVAMAWNNNLADTDKWTLRAIKNPRARYPLTLPC